MYLNMVSNRSFMDISQYPIFPWILKNYDKNLNYNNLTNELRDLNSPMGMLEITQKNEINFNRKNFYLENYNNTSEDYNNKLSTQHPYFYGSMYSNPIYISHYLIRIFPFTQIGMILQGKKFDNIDRMFTNLKTSFYNAVNNTGDLRELIPEFFYLPEIFLNLNNIQFENNKSNNDIMKNISKVELPEWSNNDPYIFITKHREFLESSEVSENLNNWMDLIFGYKQRGKPAIENKNLFFSNSYMKNIDVDHLKKEEKNLTLILLEFGLVPNQIFNKKIPNKYYSRNRKNSNLSVKNKKYPKFYKCPINFNFKNPSENPKLLKFKVIDDNNLLCVFNDNNVYHLKIKYIENKISCEKTKIIENYNYEDKIFSVSQKIRNFYNQNHSSKVIIISSNGKVKIIFVNLIFQFIAQGGYYDGGIRVIQIDGNYNNNLKIYKTRKFANVFLTTDKDEKYIFAGIIHILLYLFKSKNFKNKQNLIYLSNICNLIKFKNLMSEIKLFE